MVKNDLLDDKGKQLYDELAKLVPGHNPILDQVMLSIYVRLLQQQEKLNQEIDEAEEEQKKEVLLSIKRENERQIKEIAEEMGLTPSSKREIDLNLKMKKNKKEGR